MGFNLSWGFDDVRLSCDGGRGRGRDVALIFTNSLGDTWRTG